MNYSLTANRYRHHAVYDFQTGERISHYMTYSECCDFIGEGTDGEIVNDIGCVWDAR